jgi:hypothetical protein
MKSMKLMTLAALAFVLAACGGPAASAPAPAGEVAAVVDLAGLPRDLDAATTAALEARDDVVLIDVREQDEWDAGHIAGATLIPSSQLQSRWQEREPQQCRHGFSEATGPHQCAQHDGRGDRLGSGWFDTGTITRIPCRLSPHLPPSTGATSFADCPTLWQVRLSWRFPLRSFRTRTACRPAGFRG